LITTHIPLTSTTTTAAPHPSQHHTATPPLPRHHCSTTTAPPAHNESSTTVSDSTLPTRSAQPTPPIPRPPLHSVEGKKQDKKERILYKWIEGTTLADYNKNALKWKEYTSANTFGADFDNVMNKYAGNNEERAAHIEEFFITEA
jgi:hypothetical protein